MLIKLIKKVAFSFLQAPVPFLEVILYLIPASICCNSALSINLLNMILMVSELLNLPFRATKQILYIFYELLSDVLDEGVVMLLVSDNGAVSTDDLLTGPAVQLQLFSLVIRAVAFPL